MKQRDENETDEQKQGPRTDEGSDLEAKNDASIDMPKGTSAPDAERVLLDVKNLEGKLPAITKTCTQLQDHDYCEKTVVALEQDAPAESQDPLIVSTSEVAESSVNPESDGESNKVSEQEMSHDQADDVVSEVENSRRSMERMLVGTSDWDRKVKFLSYLGMVLKTSRRPSYEGPRLPYHWRYNLRARESSLGHSADEKLKLKSKSVSSGYRRRRNGNKARDNNSNKVVSVSGLKGTIRSSRQANNDKRAPHWCYNLRGLNVVNYKETKRVSVVVPSIVAPINRQASGCDARRLNLVGRKGPCSEVKEKQDVLHGRSRAKNKQVVRERSGKKTTKTSGQSADEPRPSKRPKKSATKSSQNQQ